jgi:UDP-N-acetylmuramoylalanine--D-glutamate ligase
VSGRAAAPLDLGPDLPRVRRAVVVGAARSGRAAADALLRRGVAVALTDAKPAAELDPVPPQDGLTTFLGGHPSEAFDGADVAVASPGAPWDAPPYRAARERGIPVVPEVELAFRLRGEGLVVGVTGTNGKSTTTALVAALLEDAGFDAVACGNIGLPWCEAVDRPRDPSRRRAYVVELSSYQLEHVTSFRADAALLLNVTPDHLDRHGTMAAYAAAKLRIFERQNANDVAVTNADDAACGLLVPGGRRLRFSRRRPLDLGTWSADEWLVGDFGRGARTLAKRADLKLVGLHNVENALAALAATVPFGVTAESAARTFARFRALPHRCALVRERDGVRWFDDSKGTNVDATLKALDGFPDGRVWIVLGGKDKGDDFGRLAPALRKKAKAALLIGAAADTIHEALFRERSSVRRVRAGTLAAAVELAAAEAAPGDVVLLSPACASFDQFKNYEHRGDVFAALVRALPPAETAS